MMGKGEKDEGIIPRLCKDLFNRINMDHDEDSQYSVEVEILVGLHDAKCMANTVLPFFKSL